MPRSQRWTHDDTVGAGRLPIIEQIPVRLDAAVLLAIQRLAARIRWTDREIDSTPADVRPGIAPGPTVHIHDMSVGMPAIRPQSNAPEYRAHALAFEGDVLVQSVPRNPVFEDYCRDFLGLGSVEVLRPAGDTGGESLAGRTRRDPALLHRLTALAATHGGLTLHPYQGAEAIWALAADIAGRATVPIRVAAPPPILTRRVNDKLWFTRQANELLGARATPPTAAIRDAADLARQVGRLIRAHDRIVIKVPGAAGGFGNEVIDAAELRGLDSGDLERELRAKLERRGWAASYPLLLSPWESPIAATPSVQLWIPPRAMAPPLVEGVFDQRVLDHSGSFVGASPSTLPEACIARLAREACIFGTLFQDLGYFGRCSFDAILVGRDPANAAPHWVQCNGRWGGTSIPMTLVHRLTGHRAASPFVVTIPRQPVRLGFADAIRQERGRLFSPGNDAGVVFLSPGLPEDGATPGAPGRSNDRGMAVLAIAPDLDQARRLADDISSALTARPH